MQVALDLLELRGLLATVLGVRIWFFGRLLVQVDLLLLDHFMTGRHARSEHVTRRERSPFLLFRRLLTTLFGLGRFFRGLFLLLQTVAGRALLGVLLGALEALLFFLGELLLELFFFRDVGAPVVPLLLSETERVAEVGAVLLACVRRRVGGVEVARRRGDGVCVSTVRFATVGATLSTRRCHYCDRVCSKRGR